MTISRARSGKAGFNFTKIIRLCQVIFYLYFLPSFVSVSQMNFIPSEVNMSVPDSSVRRVLMPSRFRRSMVTECGCPYGLPRPQEITATWGAVISRNGSDEDVWLP